MFENINVQRLALLSGALICFSALAIGAFGAHAFEHLLFQNGREAVYELANRYQFYHGLGLLLVGVTLQHLPLKSSAAIVWFMLIGTIIFSLSLYLLALTNIVILGAITPIGGACMLIGWGLLSKSLWDSL